jgi:hypothetical protein
MGTIALQGILIEVVLTVAGKSGECAVIKALLEYIGIGAIEIEVAKASMRPEIVEPSLAMTRKISPGLPSSYIPTVM